MTTQTQPDPKPEQLWRDKEDNEVAEPTDRLVKVINWITLDGYRSGFNIRQTPVTPGQCDNLAMPDGLDFRNGGQKCDMLAGPCACGAWHKLEDLTYRIFNQLKAASGQCDCAGLREAARNVLNCFSHCRTDHWWRKLDAALAQPHTCAGKSAEERIRTRCPACHNTTLAVHDGHLFCTWIDCSDPTLINRDGDLADADEARRKLAEAETSLAERHELTVHYEELYKQTRDELVAVNRAAENMAREADCETKALRRQLMTQMPQAPTWRSYATPPTEQDADDLGRVLVRWGNKACTCEHWSDRSTGLTGMKYWLPLPKLPPEPE